MIGINFRMSYSMILFGFGESKHMFTAKKLLTLKRFKFNSIRPTLKHIVKRQAQKVFKRLTNNIC